MVHVYSGSWARATRAPEGKDNVKGQACLGYKRNGMGKNSHLVNHFHKLFHGAELPHPSSKAIDQATALIARHGYDLARFTVDFAHTEAPKTKYSPQVFGGILQYTTRALAEHDRARAKEKTQTAIDQCRFCDDNGYTSFEDENGYSIVAPCPHDPDTIKAKAAARNWHHPKLEILASFALPTTPTP